MINIRPEEMNMRRPRTTGHLSEPLKSQEASADPSAQENAVVIGQALLALVIVVESQSPAGPAARAYQAAIRRNGEEAAAAGGSDAMEATLQFVRDAAPEHAEHRESIISKSWTGLLGWRSQERQP
jgi:hypothetical protein